MESSSEYDNLVMEDTVLDELLMDEKQKLIFVFDMISDRAFFMELTEMIPGKDIDEAVCTTSTGSAPVQIAEETDFAAPQKIQIPSDENFYGDEEFEIDELDEEGSGDLNFDETVCLLTIFVNNNSNKHIKQKIFQLWSVFCFLFY